MDATLQSQIRTEVQNAVVDSQNTLMTEMRNLITKEMGKLQSHNVKLAETQLCKIEETIGDSYKFKKKGNEEQSKHNNKLITKLQEADKTLADENLTEDSITECRNKIAEGITLVKHRQKLIRMADSHEAGWRVVQEYEANPLADDSDDEKKIQKAQYRAERKIKAEKAKRTESKRRYNPYPTQEKSHASDNDSSFKPGTCFGCGRGVIGKKIAQRRKTLISYLSKSLHGHGIETKVCDSSFINVQAITADGNRSYSSVSKVNTVISQTVVKVGDTSAGSVRIDITGSKNDYSSVNDLNIGTPVGRLYSCLTQWKDIGASEYVLSIIESGYKLPLKSEPDSVVLKNNRSALNSPSFVTEEVCKLLEKGCIHEVFMAPRVVNPLTVAQNKSGKLRLVLDCRHINKHLFQFKFKYENSEIAKVLFGEGDFFVHIRLKISISSHHDR